jgi:hypothetical protein
MNKKPKGHPPFVPTESDKHTVQVMAGMGVPQDMIARAILNPETGKAISTTTLLKNFQEEILNGKAHVMMGFCNALYQRGIVDRDMQAIKLYFNTQMGWSEQTNHNISAKNSDGGEVVIQVKFGREQQELDEQEAKHHKGNGTGTAIH